MNQITDIHMQTQKNRYSFSTFHSIKRRLQDPYHQPNDQPVGSNNHYVCTLMHKKFPTGEDHGEKKTALQSLRMKQIPGHSAQTVYHNTDETGRQVINESLPKKTWEKRNATDTRTTRSKHRDCFGTSHPHQKKPEPISVQVTRIYELKTNIHQVIDMKRI